LFRAGTTIDIETERAKAQVKSIKMRRLIKTLLVLTVVVIQFSGVVWAQEQITIKASNSTAHKRTVYTVDFIAPSTIQPDASVKIVFPKEFILTNNIMAGSRMLNGGLQVSVMGDTVLVQRTGLGKEIPAGTKVDVMLSDIINPGKAKDDYQISVQVKSSPMVQTSKPIMAPVAIRSKVTQK